MATQTVKREAHVRPKGAASEAQAGLRAHIRKLAGSRLFLALHFLVLVREWIDESEFGRKGKPAPWFVVPKRLYLPDGRAVPVCTVLAPPVSLSEAPSMEPIIRPQATFGGGLPPHVEVQHEDRFATVTRSTR